MRRRVLLSFAAVAALCSAAASAAAPDAATIARQGNGRGAPACSVCHSADGGGQAVTGFPRLAGLDATYLLRQLDDFATGARENTVMKPIANALSEAERLALAQYYSTMPIPDAERAPAASSSTGNALGERLALRGRWNEQVPACVACHGPHGVGVGEHFPPLAGQPAKYIGDQLRAWKQGTRHNDPLDLMKHVASALDEKDIEAVSQWFAAQPARLQGDTP